MAVNPHEAWPHCVVASVTLARLDELHGAAARYRDRPFVGPAAWIVALLVQLHRHPKARGQRGRATLRFLAWHIRRRRGRGANVVLDTGAIVAIPSWSQLGGTLAAVGIPDPEALFLARYARPGDIVYDVGANIGLYTAVALAAGAHVEAIEPSHRAAAALERTMSCNARLDSRVHEVAVADAPRTGSFTAALDVTAHLSADPDESMVTIEVTTIDSLVDTSGSAPTLIKVDAEGADLDVLLGAMASLRAHRPVLIVESWGRSEFIELLAPLGYVEARAEWDGGLVIERAATGAVNVVMVHESSLSDVHERLARPLELRRHRVRWH